MYYVVFEKKQHFFIRMILGEFFFNALLIGRAQCIAPHGVEIYTLQFIARYLL